MKKQDFLAKWQKLFQDYPFAYRINKELEEDINGIPETLWLPYYDDLKFPEDKIILLELQSKSNGNFEYQTMSTGNIKLIGKYFAFDMKQIYNITRYTLIEIP
jgi:hypothetical protein